MDKQSLRLRHKQSLASSAGKIEEFLTRAVANIIPNRKQLESVLRSGKKLNVYCGFDVTAPHLHIGNAVPLRKLQQLVDLGHNVTFLIGDFTTLVGDTSDKETERPIIPEEEIEKNWKNYASQAGKVLDLKKISVRRNSEWLSKLSFKDVIRLMQKFSLNDFISRELIKKRLSKGASINLSEVIYPVMQGYDSYFMGTDMQVGATDQTFNMQAGRILQKQLRNKDSYVVSFEFLMGTDGRKMSKSWGNAIWLDDTPEEMYGKVMAIMDGLIDDYFLLATNLPSEKIPKEGTALERKKKLAWQIVSELHSSKDADTAQKSFEKTFQQGHPEYKLRIPLQDTLAATVRPYTSHESISDAKRMIRQGGVDVNQKKVSDPSYKPSIGDKIKIGQKTFATVVKK